MTQAALTRMSSNKQLGVIPCSTSEATTCPDSCPFKAKGCYASAGFYTSQHWRKITEKTRGTNWQEFCKSVASLPIGQLWRHNVAGDLGKDPNNKDNINLEELKELIKANKGRKGYTYSHYSLNEHNKAALLEANRQGFTINASCETLEAVDEAKAAGLPAVVVVDSSKPTPKTTPQGHKIVQCPATCSNTTCALCGLCAQPSESRPAVAFPSHGSQKKAVNELLEALAA